CPEQASVKIGEWRTGHLARYTRRRPPSPGRLQRQLEAGSRVNLQGRRLMEPRDLTRIKFVSDAQVSPDGSRIAFVVTTLSEEKDEYLSNVWIVDAAGGEPRRLTSGPRRDTSPRWSPDGKRLAFVSEREPKQKPQLYVIAVDRGEATRLTTLKNGAGNPVWSPDGTRIAWTSSVGGWEESESDEETQKSKPVRIIKDQRYKL